jgi:hypothetical protein
MARVEAAFDSLSREGKPVDWDTLEEIRRRVAETGRLLGLTGDQMGHRDIWAREAFDDWQRRN